MRLPGAYPFALIPIGILYCAGIATGLVPFSGTLIGWVSIGCLSIALYVFLEPIHKVWFLFFSAYIGTFFGGMSLAAFFAGLCAAALVTELLFSRIIKHHAPPADTVLIALGTYAWIFVSAFAQWVLAAYGFSEAFVSGWSVWSAMIAAVPMVCAVFFCLIIISNYSKYGSVFRM